MYTKAFARGPGGSKWTSQKRIRLPYWLYTHIYICRLDLVCARACQEGWFPTLSYSLYIALRDEESAADGIEAVREGDILVGYTQRGLYVYGTRLGLQCLAYLVGLLLYAWRAFSGTRTCGSPGSPSVKIYFSVCTRAAPAGS